MKKVAPSNCTFKRQFGQHELDELATTLEAVCRAANTLSNLLDDGLKYFQKHHKCNKV